MEEKLGNIMFGSDFLTLDTKKHSQQKKNIDKSDYVKI